MDVPAAAAGPWIALGAVLGILLLLAVGAVAFRLRSRRPAPAVLPRPADEPRDDLVDFLAHPPGFPGAYDDDGDGWVPLGATERPADRNELAPLPASPGSRPGTVLAGLAVVTLLLVGTAAALAASARSPQPPPATEGAPSTGSARTGTPAAAPGRGEVTARLAFGGVVLEEHAVGITAAYPELELSVDGERAVAHLRLPTANCLAVSAPPPAGDPSCRSARTEYADLSAPDLSVVRDGDQLTVSGRFATYLRPPGAPAKTTGRSYELTATVAPAGADRAGSVPAEGRLRWDDQRTTTRTDSRSVLCLGG